MLPMLDSTFDVNKVSRRRADEKRNRQRFPIAVPFVGENIEVAIEALSETIAGQVGLNGFERVACDFSVIKFFEV
jgi:hypothetical protein